MGLPASNHAHAQLQALFESSSSDPQVTSPPQDYNDTRIYGTLLVALLLLIVYQVRPK